MEQIRKINAWPPIYILPTGLALQCSGHQGTKTIFQEPCIADVLNPQIQQVRAEI